MSQKLEVVTFFFLFLFLSISINSAATSSNSLADDVEIKVYGKLFGVVFEVENQRNESIDVNITINITKLFSYDKTTWGLFCLFQADTTYEINYFFRFFGKIKVTASFEDIYIEKNGFIICGYWFLR